MYGHSAIPEVSPLGSTEHPLGRVSTNPPIPILESDSEYFVTDEILIAVESRVLNQEIILKHAAQFEGGVERVQSHYDQMELPDDAGLSIHVLDAATRREWLRFDMFSTDPHYHYLPDEPYHIAISYDVAANGDMLEWTLGNLSSRLNHMLRAAGATDLSETIDQSGVAKLVEDIRSTLDADRFVIPGRNR